MEPVDFGPAARTMASLVGDVTDDQLDGPTPCPDWTVADLLRHIGGLTLEFTASATKVPTPARAGAGLTDDWRGRIRGDLESLAEAWTNPEAYQGETHAGPVTLPGQTTARIALNEVTVHGWDLAQATGQEYTPDEPTVRICSQHVATFDAPADGGVFGPPVETAPDASAMDRLVGLTGRDPAWTPG